MQLITKAGCLKNVLNIAPLITQTGSLVTSSYTVNKLTIRSKLNAPYDESGPFLPVLKLPIFSFITVMMSSLRTG